MRRVSNVRRESQMGERYQTCRDKCRKATTIQTKATKRVERAREQLRKALEEEQRAMQLAQQAAADFEQLRQNCRLWLTDQGMPDELLLGNASRPGFIRRSASNSHHKVLAASCRAMHRLIQRLAVQGGTRTDSIVVLQTASPAFLGAAETLRKLDARSRSSAFRS